MLQDFAGVAENLGVYTAKDYAEIMKWLINYWKIDQMTGLNNEALAEQQYVCALPDRILKLAERSAGTGGWLALGSDGEVGLKGLACFSSATKGLLQRQRDAHCAVACYRSGFSTV